jgi:hypothetical protein
LEVAHGFAQNIVGQNKEGIRLDVATTTDLVANELLLVCGLALQIDGTGQPLFEG